MADFALPHDHGRHKHDEALHRELMNTERFSAVADVFKKLSDPVRVRIFWLLSHREECVINIAAMMDMSSPAVSHHLKSLLDSGLIMSRRDGKEVYYKASDTEQIGLLHEIVEQVMEITCPEKEVDFQASQEEIIRNVHNYLIEHISERITIETLSREFLMNTTTLKTVFKKVYGTTIAAHMKQHRMELAAGLLLKTQNDAEYSAVSNTSQGQDGLVWLSGYLPVGEAEGLKKAAAQAHWAWAMDDPAGDDEKVPTKVQYNKVTKLMIPVFDILGTVPGYREYDISFWFLGFFTLFFAMIIGDAGYGCLFLLAALVLTLKGKGSSNAVQLLWVLSAATVIWGALTGTWFGLEQAMDVPLLKSLVIPTFANYPAYFDVSTTTQQNTIMKFCFILGTVQLSLACVMNIRRKLKEKDLSWVSDLGWLAAIDALYFVVLYLVIGQQVNLLPVAGVVIAGFLLVVCFGGMSPDKSFVQGLKAGLGNAFTVFLNTISAFGNIMSYIRLFAVGMASLAIAQSFNDMAFSLNGPLVIAAVLVLLIGHGLNIVMGLLSVVVHGVRLNLLEFSGQLGMEWAGIAYDPFKKRDKIKK